MNQSGHIIDVTAETFEESVIERSAERPVVVDFWAAWCGPCRQLVPLLESLATEFAGRFVLAKVDIDSNQELAAAFHVQSIPHVVAIKNKQLVDQFLGLLPEARLREWIERIVPSPAEELVQLGEQLEAEDVAAAESKYREALSLEPRLAPATIALARVLTTQQRFDEARELMATLEQRGFLEPAAERLKATLAVVSTAAASGGVAAARAAVESHPENLSLKLPLADALATAGQPAEALDLCLEVIRQDKVGVGVAAKDTMLNILNVIDDPTLASEYRRKLTSALY